MTRFVVDLGKADVTDAQKTAIAHAIHAAVLPHVAALSTTGGGKLMSLASAAGFCAVESPDDAKDAHARLAAAAAAP